MDPSQHDVAIFWDFENCRPATQSSGHDVADSIRRLAHTFGAIKTFKAYLDVSECLPASSISTKTSILRSQLQSSGVSLTDCPHNGQKDVADIMMIVDMMSYAMDTSPVSTTFVVITADRDFTYVLSVLRLRNFPIVLITKENAATCLRSRGSVCYDWNMDILQKGPLINTGRVGVDISGFRYPSNMPSNPARDGVFPQAISQKLLEPTEAVSNKPSFTHLRMNAAASDSEADLATNSRYDASPVQDADYTDSETDADTDEDGRSAPSAEYSLDDYSESEDDNVPTFDTAKRSSHSSSPPRDSPLAPFTRFQSYPFTPPHLPKRKALPAGFMSLIIILERYLEDQNEAKPLCSEVALDIIADEEDIYAQATVTRFKEYRALAECAGIVECGFRYGQSSTKWIKLLDWRRRYYDPRLLEVVGLEFEPLVQCLERFRKKGICRPLRSVVALELINQDSTVYKQAGVAKFAGYSALAIEADIVIMGGSDGGAWIAFDPEWYAEYSSLLG